MRGVEETKKTLLIFVHNKGREKVTHGAIKHSFE
jgi:hypothetical protein